MRELTTVHTTPYEDADDHRFVLLRSLALDACLLLTREPHLASGVRARVPLPEAEQAVTILRQLAEEFCLGVDIEAGSSALAFRLYRLSQPAPGDSQGTAP
ncbi:MAG: hypothetical protein WEB00_01825 [Dehalococcoidia bacterium]